MDQPSVDRRSGDGVKLDYNTSIRPEEPRWKRMMSMGLLIALPVIEVLCTVCMYFFLLPDLLSVMLGIAWLYHLFRFRRELLRWLLGEFRTWHARACVDIFNFKNACSTFVNKLPIWKTDRRNDELKHFKWTCHCGRIFEETAREVVPGGVAEWIDAWGFPDEPMAQPLSSADLEASARSPYPDFAALYVSAFRFGAISAISLVRAIYGVLALIRLFFDFESESRGLQAKLYHIFDFSSTILYASLIVFLVMSRNPREPPQRIEHIDTSLRAGTGKPIAAPHAETIGATGEPVAAPYAETIRVTGEPLAAPYAETIGMEQGGRAPRDGNSPPSPKIEREDAPPHSEYVLLLIKQGRHRMKFFSTDIRKKWTDRDTFHQIKDRYDCFKSSWWYLNTLSHVEFKKFHIYHSNYIDIADREKEEVPICEQRCEGGCGLGCLGYWYTPPRVKMIPPIPRKAMMHFLKDPDCLGTNKYNRGALPKRQAVLNLGDLQLKEGWGLNFKEKVWSLPIVTVQLLSIINAIVLTVIWWVKDERNVELFLPGVLVITVGQSIATLLQKWAESNLDEEPKA